MIAWLLGSGVYTQGYGNDIRILVVRKFPNTVSGLIQCALRTVETWCDKLGLSVNPDKTGLVAFTRKRTLPGLFEPRLFGMTRSSKTSMLRDNESNAHQSYHCSGGIYLPPSTEARGTECDEVSCISSLESCLTYIPTEDIKYFDETSAVKSHI